jgi:hypothetical protein
VAYRRAPRSAHGPTHGRKITTVETYSGIQFTEEKAKRKRKRKRRKRRKRDRFAYWPLEGEKGGQNYFACSKSSDPFILQVVRGSPDSALLRDRRSPPFALSALTPAVRA